MAALDSLRVIDLATGAAAFAGRLLADFGAEVIKVEPPGGEVGRRTPPFAGGESLFFWHYNLGKRSVTLKVGDGRLDRLVAGADVVIDSEGPYEVRPGPRTIWASIRGFGTGPRETWRATELVAQAAGGLVYVNGEPDREPLRAYGDQAHHLASHYLVNGILLALRVRRRTGQGQRIQVTLQEAVASALEQLPQSWIYHQRIRRREGRRYWLRGWGAFACRDGWVELPWFRNWDDVVALLAGDDAADDLADDRYQEISERDAADDHIRDVLGRWAADRSAVEIMEQGQAFRLPWAVIQSPAAALADPHLAARGFFRSIPGPGGDLPASGAPAILSATPWHPSRPAPALGADNALLAVL